MGLAREYIEEQCKSSDLAGINVTFNEVFTDPPTNLDPEGAGKIGWYVRIADGRVEVDSGVLPSADLKLTVDYQTVLPAARRMSTDEPLAEAQQQALTDAINREGDASVLEGFTYMEGLHDAMAARTQ